MRKVVKFKNIFDFFPRAIYNLLSGKRKNDFLKGGEEKMKKAISAILSLFLIGMFMTVLVGCGADIKAENEKLKTENTSLKSDNDKLKIEVQKLKEEIQKAAEKESVISSLTAENEALKKQMEDLKSQLPKKKK